jgi:SAM-dependent methyltransferase
VVNRDKVLDWFYHARAREIPDLIEPSPGPWLDLGAGKRPMPGCEPLDLEHGWDADKSPIPKPANSVTAIFAHAFLGYVESPVSVLAECQRVLVKGGLLFVVEPHASSDLWNEDILRRNRFHEETWSRLLDNPWYDAQARGPALDRLKVHTCFTMGVVWRNMSLFTQLVKV